MRVLRRDQELWLDEIAVAFRRGNRRVLAIAPTGFGKTHTIAFAIKKAIDSGEIILFVAPLREIVFDTVNRLRAQGVFTGVLLGDEPVDLLARVQVASAQTLWSRFSKNPKSLPHATFVVVDEGHHGVADTWVKLQNEYSQAWILILTATPEGSGGRPLGSIADVLVKGPRIDDLVKAGHLCHWTLRAPSEAVAEGLARDPVELLKEHPERRSIVFCESKAHAKDVVSRACALGVSAETILGDTEKDVRDSVRARIKSGETRALIVCGVALEGFDCPSLDMAILAAPFRTIGRFRQAIGRVLRPCEGKRDALIWDLTGAVHVHGLPNENIEWQLHGETSFRRDPDRLELRHCSECLAIWSGSNTCPRCGVAKVASVKSLPVIATKEEKMQAIESLPRDVRDRAYFKSLFSRFAKHNPHDQARAIAHRLFEKNRGYKYAE